MLFSRACEGGEVLQHCCVCVCVRAPGCLLGSCCSVLGIHRRVLHPDVELREQQGSVCSREQIKVH